MRSTPIEPGRELRYSTSLFIRKITYMTQLLYLRWVELKSRIGEFIILQLILPMFVVLLICLLCGDVHYSKLHLASSTLGGFGECIGAIWQDTLFLNLSAADKSNDGSILWIAESLTSDDLLLLLYTEYFDHSKNRYAGFVIGDYTEWIESSIVIPSSSLATPMGEVYSTLISKQNDICSTNSDSPVCQSSVTITHLGNENALVITSLNFLRSNITFLLNSTSDHTAPMYFKELMSFFNPKHQVQNYHGHYNLYSYPLQTISHANSVLFLRGYVVSNMIVLYLLLTSVVAVKTIVRFRGGGIKHQVHSSMPFVLCIFYLFHSCILPV